MNFTLRSALTVFSILLATTSSQLLAQIQITRDIRYTNSAGVVANLQSLDVYAPSGAISAPVMIGIHGGGWQAGDKGNADFVQNKALYFTARGWIFVSINYRLSPAVMHPAHVQDVAAAINWAYVNIGSYGGNRERLFLLGHSAGAHLAALVATDESRIAAAGGSLSIVKGVIALDTAKYDLDAVYPSGSELDGSVLSTFGNDPLVLRDGSPIDHLAADKYLPPFAIFHLANRADASAGSNAFFSALRSVGATAEIHSVSDRTHGSINELFGTVGDPTTQWSQAFLDQSLAALAAVGTGPGGLDASYAGTWWDPARSGEGVLLDVSGNGAPSIVVFSWYTYDLAGNPIYLAGSGSLSAPAGEVTASVVTTGGTRFGAAFNPAEVQRLPWGEVDLIIVDCNNLRLRWRPINAAWGAGERVLRRFLPHPSGLTCP